MLKFFAAIFCITQLFDNSIYDYKLTRSDGSEFDLGTCKGKKILIVNIATSSKYSDQIEKLEQLYEQYQSSLVIIAIPSNDFGSEPLSDNQLNDLLKSQYNATFVIGQKLSVNGTNQSAIYNWLTSRSMNGMADSNVTEDFRKYLIDENGKLIGLFVSSVDPLSDELQNPIKAQ